jgi:RNA polymerase sigma-70 factor (ECF subfamily)
MPSGLLFLDQTNTVDTYPKHTRKESMPSSPDVTQMLLQWGQGNPEIQDDLARYLYTQLKEMAHARLNHERPDHTFATTDLVHEAYLKLVDINRVQWQDRTHFLAMAARVMRRILIDYAIRRNAKKRGGGNIPLALNEEQLVPEAHTETLLDLDDALHQLETFQPRQSKAVELYYFGGMTLEEVGKVLGVSTPTAMRDLRAAEAWLAREWNGTLDILR